MRYIGSTVVALGLLALPLSAGAQEKPRQPERDRAVQQERAKEQRAPEARADRDIPRKVAADAINVNELRDARVVDKKGEELGQVRELRVHPQEGRITHAEIGVGGVLGIGQERFTVDWKQIEVMERNGRIVLALSDEAAQKARAAAGDRDRDRAEPRKAPAEREAPRAPAPGAPAPGSPAR